MSAEPFAIGLDDLETEEEPPTRVPPPVSAGTGEPSAGSVGSGATPADGEVREVEPGDFEQAGEASADADAGADADEAPVAGPLSDEDVERVARRVVELLGDRPIREVAWEVVPDLAEVVIRDRLRELETQVESAD
jgi:hypothetical protein